MFYEVILGRNGVSEALTYSSDSPLEFGTIVEVPIGKGKSAGIIYKKVAQPIFKTKKITKVLYSTPLPKHLLETVKFISEYYVAPSSSVVAMILPNGILKNRRKTQPKTEQALKLPLIQLNTAQKNALESLQKAQEATKLLFGVTGSGKTNIYLKEAARAISAQKSVILLVPEIALTGQLVRVFRETFGDRIVLMHSGQTEAERHLIFESLLKTNGAKVIIGPRSALFAPINNLGLIVIDEEHESTYFQENTPKYSAVRVASFMAKILGIDCILGSATPNVSDYYIAEKKNALVKITEKAKSTAVKPKVQIIDLKNRDNFTKNRYFSNSLLAAIKDNLENKRQTLIFHNRRGSAPLTICDNCGEEVVCPNCYLPLTLHADTYELICHTCGFKMRVPTKCPHCGAPELIHKGFGTKLLESELLKLFPNAKIGRFDGDTKRNKELATVYDSVKDGKIDILVGTQTLAKGLDLPKLATVGIVQADAGLSLPDFAAEERTFQLLTQVIGRVGRGHLDKAEVFIQTFRPTHPIINYAINEDFEGFYKYILSRRRLAGLPPFSFIAQCEITMKTEQIVLQKLKETVAKLRSNKDLIVSPPVPKFHEKTNRGHSWQIIIRAKSRKALIGAMSVLGPNFYVTLDPPSLL